MKLWAGGTVPTPALWICALLVANRAVENTVPSTKIAMIPAHGENAFCLNIAVILDDDDGDGDGDGVSEPVARTINDA
jgi:hypothetical protein